MGSGLIHKRARIGENNTLALWLADRPGADGGILADLLSPWSYDEPEILPASNRQFGPIGANAGQLPNFIQNGYTLVTYKGGGPHENILSSSFLFSALHADWMCCW